MRECYPSDSYSAPSIDTKTSKILCRDSTARLSPTLQDYMENGIEIIKSTKFSKYIDIGLPILLKRENK